MQTKSITTTNYETKAILALHCFEAI